MSLMELLQTLVLIGVAALAGRIYNDQGFAFVIFKVNGLALQIVDFEVVDAGSYQFTGKQNRTKNNRQGIS